MTSYSLDTFWYLYGFEIRNVQIPEDIQLYAVVLVSMENSLRKYKLSSFTPRKHWRAENM